MDLIRRAGQASCLTLLGLLVVSAARGEAYTLSSLPPLRLAAPDARREESAPWVLVTASTLSSPLLAGVKTDASGEVYLRPADLQKLRIKVDESLLRQEWVSTRSLPGARFDYRPATRELYVTVAPGSVLPYVVDLKGEDLGSIESAEQHRISATVLNYSLYNQTYRSRNYFSGYADLTQSTPAGNFFSSASFGQATSGREQGLVRLDTYWQRVDPVRVMSYQAGDFISNAADWGTSVRLAGVQVASAYQQRSDIVTAALPRFGGSASVATSLDVFVEQSRVYSGEIPAGPFDVSMLPYISGDNLTMVTRDVAGNQVVKKFSYYYSPKILREGIHEYSLDVGVPRFNYGTKSASYDASSIYASGAWRQAVSENNTVALSGETTSDGLINAGAGWSGRFLGRGVLSLAGAASQWRGQSGTMGKVSVEGRIAGSLRANAEYRAENEGYYSLSRVANEAYYRKYARTEDEDEAVSYTSRSRETLRAGLYFSPADSVSVGAYYNGIRYDTGRFSTVSLTTSFGLTDRLSLSVSAYRSLSDSDRGGYVYLSYNFADKYIFSGNAERSNGRTSFSERVDNVPASGINTLSWGVGHGRSGVGYDRASGYATYTSRYGRYEVSAESGRGGTITGLLAEGAVIYADNSLFLANKTGDSFAIVKNAGPGSRITNGGVDAGSVSPSGSFLLTSLTPYQPHHIYLNTRDLPPEWQTDGTERVAVTPYAGATLVDFGARRTVSATLTVTDAQGSPLKPGYEAVLNNVWRGVTGYGGQVYLEDIRPINHVTVDLLNLGHCTFTFTYDGAYAAAAPLGPYVCRK